MFAWVVMRKKKGDEQMFGCQKTDKHKNRKWPFYVAPWKNGMAKPTYRQRFNVIDFSVHVIEPYILPCHLSQKFKENKHYSTYKLDTYIFSSLFSIEIEIALLWSWLIALHYD